MQPECLAGLFDRGEFCPGITTITWVTRYWYYFCYLYIKANSIVEFVKQGFTEYNYNYFIII